MIRRGIRRAVRALRRAGRPAAAAPAETGNHFEGFVDEIGERHVIGWVRDRRDPALKLTVEAVLTASGLRTQMATAAADQLSAGLAIGDPDNAEHGFRIEFAEPLTPAQRDQIAVRIAGIDFTIPRAPHLDIPKFGPFEDFRADGFEFAVDAVTKFYNTIRVFGWFAHPSDTLKAVRIIDDGILSTLSEVGIAHGGVLASHGPDKGFSVQVFRRAEPLSDIAEIEFTAASGWTGRANLKGLCRARLHPQFYKTSLMLHAFLASLDHPGARILDIGGRSRSRNDFSLLFKHAECVVLDILPGENVDVVGDAHAMADFLPPESFDAVYSVSTFEHLLMPWAVAVQMNKILKPGGTALIFSHQTLAIHDPPWDFWRFSDTAWDALFNERTGFKIIDRAMSFEQHVLPFIWRPNKSNEERAVGFEGSAVLIRKTGPSTMSWNLTPGDLTNSSYPA
jgi:hypothetical protein